MTTRESIELWTNTVALASAYFIVIVFTFTV